MFSASMSLAPQKGCPNPTMASPFDTVRRFILPSLYLRREKAHLIPIISPSPLFHILRLHGCAETLSCCSPRTADVHWLLRDVKGRLRRGCEHVRLHLLSTSSCLCDIGTTRCYLREVYASVPKYTQHSLLLFVNWMLISGKGLRH